MRVINKHTATNEEKLQAVFIGRPSALENPFKMTDGYLREEVIQLFRDYFITQLILRNPAIEEAFRSLTPDSLLMCYCAPKDCHGDVISEFYKEIMANPVYEAGLEAFIKNHQYEIDQESIDLLKQSNSYVTPVYLMNALLKESPEFKATDSEEERLNKFDLYITRQIMSRNPRLENAIRFIQANPKAFDKHSQRHDIIGKKFQVIRKHLTMLNSHQSYDEAIHYYKEHFNQLAIDYLPEEDGVTHINVYSKGKTEVGRMASNFAHTPIRHPRYGYFASIEAFWYWLSTGKTDDRFRNLYGFQAKKLGLTVREEKAKLNITTDIKEFEVEIKEALLLKVQQNDRFRQLLKDSSLPLTHYYAWGDPNNYRITYPTEYAWIHQYISDLRDFVQGKADIVLIAGSRNIDDLPLIEQAYKDSGFKAIQFVSGMAKGVDANCVALAKKMKLPLAEFHADWDKQGKSAGYIRNTEMGKYATAAVIIWDGKSPGTKSMIDICQRTNLKHIVLRVDS